MLQQHNIVLDQVVDARKEALAAEATWALLSSVREVVVAKGKNFVIFNPQQATKEELLKQALGRSGTLRAPALRSGDRLLVGFSDALYAHYLG